MPWYCDKCGEEDCEEHGSLHWLDEVNWLDENGFDVRGPEVDPSDFDDDDEE